jgi:ABC-2 type transport system permease protein
MKNKNNEKSQKIIDVRKVSAIIKKNYITISRDKARLLPALLFPIVIMLVLGYATGSTPKHIPTAIVIHDESPISQSIIQAISGSQYFSVSKVVSTEGEARELLDRGKIKVIVEIPPDLQDNIDNNMQSGIMVIVDESDSSIALTSRSILQVIISQISSQVSQQKFRAYQELMSVSSQKMNFYINNFQCQQSSGQTIFPLNYQQQSYNSNVMQPLLDVQLFSQVNPVNILQPIVYEEKPAYGVGRQALDFVIPALIAMTIFQGAVQGMGRSVAGEKREGSLTRVFLTPTSNVTIITGTLLFYIIFETIRASLLILLSVFLFGVRIEGSYLLIGIVLVIYIAICTSLGMLISATVKTEQQFQGIALLISLPVLFLSGVFFPIQAMPKFMQVIAQIFPVTYAADALRSVMVKGLGISTIILPLAILMLFLIVILIATVMLFKRDIE